MDNVDVVVQVRIYNVSVLQGYLLYVFRVPQRLLEVVMAFPWDLHDHSQDPSVVLFYRVEGGGPAE